MKKVFCYHHRANARLTQKSWISCKYHKREKAARHHCIHEMPKRCWHIKAKKNSFQALFWIANNLHEDFFSELLKTFFLKQSKLFVFVVDKKAHTAVERNLFWKNLHFFCVCMFLWLYFVSRLAVFLARSVVFSSCRAFQTIKLKYNNWKCWSIKCCLFFLLLTLYIFFSKESRWITWNVSFTRDFSLLSLFNSKIAWKICSLESRFDGNKRKKLKMWKGLIGKGGM